MTRSGVERSIDRAGLAEPALAGRVALTLEEAAAAIGLSARAFRDHLFPGCPKFYAGTSPRIPIRPFVKFVEDLAIEEQTSTKDSAREILARTERRRREK